MLARPPPSASSPCPSAVTQQPVAGGPAGPSGHAGSCSLQLRGSVWRLTRRPDGQGGETAAGRGAGSAGSCSPGGWPGEGSRAHRSRAGRVTPNPTAPGTRSEQAGPSAPRLGSRLCPSLGLLRGFRGRPGPLTASSRAKPHFTSGAWPGLTRPGLVWSD